MNDSEGITTHPAGLGRYVWVLAAAWTVAVVGSLVWNVLRVKQGTLEDARIQARALYAKDIVYRRWVAGHGGVYVPVTAKTPPNPYLSRMPERNITTPSGRQLTLINPAYMTRQVHELADQEYGIRGHITSLKPIRPENAPDPWETKALQAFERGQREVSSVQQEYMRLMRPLITEKGCLKCHAAQGYREGDIRGGISTSVPMAPLKAIAARTMLTLGMGHLFLWLMGMGGIILGTQRLRRKESDRSAAAQALQEAKDDLQTRVEERTSELSIANKQLSEDISEHKRLEEKLARAKDAAEAGSKAKSDFLANMSHELRTPLNAIIGFSEGLLERADRHPLNDHQKDRIAKMLQSGGHLLALINNVLDIAKVEDGQTEINITTFPVRPLAEEMADLAQELVRGKEEVTFSLELTDEVTLLTSDRDRVRQILVNLVSNAIKFTDQGSVTLRIQYHDGYIDMVVEDTGTGIPEDQLVKIFQKFYQLPNAARESRAGTGLGLSIAKLLAERLGGTLTVESVEGQGSSFALILPTVSRAAVASDTDETIEHVQSV
jgi:signal transduction histidine kinase